MTLDARDAHLARAALEGSISELGIPAPPAAPVVEQAAALSEKSGLVLIRYKANVVDPILFSMVTAILNVAIRDFGYQHNLGHRPD